MKITPQDLPELDSLPFFHDPDPRPSQTSPTGFTVPPAVHRHLTGSAAEQAPHRDDQRLIPVHHTPEPAAHPDHPPRLEEDAAFWQVVADLRRQAVTAFTEADDPTFTPAQREALGRAQIAKVVTEHLNELVRLGGQQAADAGHHRRARTETAIFNQIFRLGRYQDLLDDPQVENIHIHGCDQVFVELTGGRMERRGPVASSDEELMADLQFYAGRDGENARPFSTHHPDLDIDLLGYVRLAAIATPIAERPSAVLRVHRYINITLEQLVELQLLSAQAAQFLTYAVEAKRSIVITGFGGDGKTTLMRALAAKIGPWEQIVTVEKERELHLKNLENRMLPPFSLQYRPGSGERGPDGRSPGEYTLEQCMEKALRLNSQRIMVGEVRGLEIISAIQAMQVGAGTFCTTHAYSPEDAIDRLTGLGMREYSAEYMRTQLAQHLDLIVQLDKRPDAEGNLVRKVTHISEVQPGEGARGVAINDLFRLEPGDELARWVALPSNPRLLQALERAGLEAGEFTAQWAGERR